MKINIYDGLKSMIGNLGNPERDKAASVTFANEDIPDSDLAAAYETNWIASRLIGIPATDATRKWRNWANDDDKLLEHEEQRLKVKSKTYEAMWKARLYGGAAIFIGTDQDASEPLVPSTLSKGDVKYLTVLIRNIDITAGEEETDALKENYGEPSCYTVSSSQTVKIHPSRLVIFKGAPIANDNTRTAQSYGWGNSVLKSTYKTMTNCASSYDNVASLLFEANVDVIGIPDLMNNIGSGEYETNLLKRFQLASANKGINGTLILDKEEEYNRKSASFATLPDLLDKFATACAASDGIPATIFLAKSPDGMNATGESDFDIHYERISGEQARIGQAMQVLDDCLIASSESQATHYDWNPLKQMSDKDVAEVIKIKTEAVRNMDTMSITQESQYEMQRQMGMFDNTEINTFEDYKGRIDSLNGEVL